MTRTLIALASLVIATPAIAQTQPAAWKGENLQVFPKDIARPALIQRMREFALGLNVRCQYCHSGGDGVSLDGVNFAADDKPAKNKARAMLRMVDQLNNSILPQLPSRVEPRVEVGCVTCHHGLAVPKTLQTTLLEVIDKEGVPAAIARYRSLRDTTMVTGTYNFGEIELSDLARKLIDAKKGDAAIAMLELNGEFNPKSPEIDFQLGEVHLQRGERDLAIRSYRAALTKAPQHPGAIRRLADLEKKQH